MSENSATYRCTEPSGWQMVLIATASAKMRPFLCRFHTSPCHRPVALSVSHIDPVELGPVVPRRQDPRDSCRSPRPASYPVSAVNAGLMAMMRPSAPHTIIASLLCW